MERPIIFSIEMVRAILDGRKTMTRRVIKPQPILKSPDWEWQSCTWKEYVKTPEFPIEHCPYGQVGDRLWVRESFFYGSGDYDSRTCVIRYAVDDVEIKYKIPDSFPWDKTCKWCYTKLDGSHPIRPSIFMPRWASRLTLEITGVRVERLQKITEEDAQAEGVLWCREGATPDARHHFMVLWDSLNAKRGYGWDGNPWVWVISFRKVM